jgi:uncharacterized protein (TIGR03437 family)
MLRRVCAICAVSIALPAVLLRAQDLFVLPGAGAASGNAESFVTNPLTTYRTFAVGNGAFAVFPNATGTTFYVVSSSTANSVYELGSSLLTGTTLANLPASATQAVLTPDQSVIAVAAGAVHLFSTTSNTELVPGGISQGPGVNTFAVAASLDDKAIFALGTDSSGNGELSSISNSSYTVTESIDLPEPATAVSVGPNGLVYVSLPNEMLELNPQSLQTTPNGAIYVSGTPGALLFTPDGQYALGANQSALGNSLLVASLATHTGSAPNTGLAQITSLEETGIDTVLAISTQGLYQIALSPFSVAPVAVPNLGVTGLLSETVTNDVPSGAHSTVQSAYLLSTSAVYQLNPATQTIVNQYALASNVMPGVIQYAVPPATGAQSVPASLLLYGNNQTIPPNATAEPLVVRVLGAGNLPLSGYTVQFQISGAASALSASSVLTGANGYAVTYLTASDTTGAVTVTASAGSLTATFSLNISTTAQSTGPTLTIVAGQGQLMAEETTTALGPAYGTSLQVMATDANGNPISDLPIIFSVPAGDGTLQASGVGASSQTVDTNSSGIASIDFETTLLPANDNQAYFQSLITASAANSNTVTFYINTVQTTPAPTVNLLTPTPGTPLTGAEGTTAAAAVKVQVYSAAGIPIPNVSLTLSDYNANPSQAPSLSCNAPGGLVLTNSLGFASCDVTFGPRVGSGNFVVNIGETHVSVPLAFAVTAGAPSTVGITQGNNQTGGPGQTLPLALVVHVTDSGGNIVAGAKVAWQVTTAGSVTLSDVISVTDNNGNASALATLGSVGGPAQVTATVGSVTATFNLTVNIPSAGLQKVSGDQQTAIVNAPFALPLTVEVVNSSGSGVAGAQVNFQVTAGAATLSSSAVITNPAGQASVNVTAGATPGAITVTATTATFSVTFTLTGVPPGPTNITIVNGASFDPNTGISPGAIATIRGTGILPGVTGVVVAPTTNGQYPTTFSGVTVTFNGTPAPIYYVEDTNGADQLSVQVPFEVQPGSAVSLGVSVANEGATTVVMVPVLPVAPGIFTSVYAGKPYAVAVRPDSSYVSPTNPAQRGENIQLYVTGLGQATPTIDTNTPGVADQTITSTLVVGLNNGGVPLVSAVYAPGLVGIYVVTLQVPMDTQTGPYQPVGLIAYDSSNNQHYAQPTYIPIE